MVSMTHLWLLMHRLMPYLLKRTGTTSTWKSWVKMHMVRRKNLTVATSQRKGKSQVRKTLLRIQGMAKRLPLMLPDPKRLPRPTPALRTMKRRTAYLNAPPPRPCRLSRMSSLRLGLIERSRRRVGRIRSPARARAPKSAGQMATTVRRPRPTDGPGALGTALATLRDRRRTTTRVGAGAGTALPSIRAERDLTDTAIVEEGAVEAGEEVELSLGTTEMEGRWLETAAGEVCLHQVEMTGARRIEDVMTEHHLPDETPGHHPRQEMREGPLPEEMLDHRLLAEMTEAHLPEETIEVLPRAGMNAWCFLPERKEDHRRCRSFAKTAVDETTEAPCHRHLCPDRRRRVGETIAVAPPSTAPAATTGGSAATDRKRVEKLEEAAVASAAAEEENTSKAAAVSLVTGQGRGDKISHAYHCD
jgi:hypothetical protein